MSQRVPLCADFPATEEEVLRMLGRFNRIEHDRNIAGCRILHAHRNADATGDHAMELVFDGPGADGCIGQEVRQVAEDFRIEDFFGTGKARFADDAGIHFTDGDDAAQHVFLAFRVGLVEHAFVADADSTRFAGIDARNDENFIFDLFLDFDQAVDIIEDGRFVIGRAGPDDEQETVVFPCQDVLDFFIPFRLDGFDLVVDGKLFHQFLRFR